MLYIEENLEKIRNPKNILYFKNYWEGNKKYLGVVLVTGKGQYEKVALTKPVSQWAYQCEPVYMLYRDMRLSYLKDFVWMDNYIAFNKEYFSGFGYAPLIEEPKRIALFANFKDGSATFINTYYKNRFENKILEKTRELLIKNGIEPMNDQPYEGKLALIEHFLNDNVAIIPEIQESEENLENN